MIMHYNTRHQRINQHYSAGKTCDATPASHSDGKACSQLSPNPECHISIIITQLQVNEWSVRYLIPHHKMPACCAQTMEFVWKTSSRFMCRSVGAFLKEGKVKSEVGGIWLWQQRWRPPGAAGSTNILSHKTSLSWVKLYLHKWLALLERHDERGGCRAPKTQSNNSDV